jgi:hypothetical protein
LRASGALRVAGSLGRLRAVGAAEGRVAALGCAPLACPSVDRAGAGRALG